MVCCVVLTVHRYGLLRCAYRCGVRGAGVVAESVLDAEPPEVQGGAVTAVAAAGKGWTRRKQSMMFAPMPEHYKCAMIAMTVHFP